MEHTNRTSTESVGKINGRSVCFRDEYSDDAGSNRLTWTDEDQIQPGAEPQIIYHQDIIALLPDESTDTERTYKLLSVPKTNTQDAAESISSLRLQITRASQLPQLFVDKFLLSAIGGPAGFHSSTQADQSQPNDHVIVSTGSGTSLAVSVWEQVVQPALREASLQQDVHYTLHTTTSDTSISELTTSTILPKANTGISQKLILLSGDGGVVDIVNALLSASRSSSYVKPTLAVLPLGTGNALANSAGIAADRTLGLSTAFRGVIKELPLFRATFSPGARLLVNEARDERKLDALDAAASPPDTAAVPVAYGAVVCSWGFHAGLVADSDTAEYRKFGAARFGMAGKEALFPSDGSAPHVYRARVLLLRPLPSPDAGIVAGGEEWEEIRHGEHAYVLATPVSQLEKGFRISPASRPMDGKLRLVHFGPLAGDAVMEIMTKAYQGGLHVQDERVGYEEIAALRIEFEEEDARWRRVCVDGKIIRVEKGGWVEVRAGQKGVVDVMVPREDEG